MSAFDDIKNKEGVRTAEKWAIFGVIGNILLTVFKAYAGVVGSSNAMVADAMHSASGILLSAVVYATLKIAQKPADDKHPFGYGKVEAIATSIVGLLLMASSIPVITTSYTSIIKGSSQSPGIIALYAAIISMIAKEAMYRASYKAGRRVSSPSTIANARNHRSDAISSIATFIGIGGAILGLHILDPLAAIIVALYIFRMGYVIVVNSVNQLMDKSLDENKIVRIKNAINYTPGVKGISSIHVRQSGPYYLVDLDICIDKNLSLDEANDISLNVRKNIYRVMEKIFEVRIHLDPR